MEPAASALEPAAAEGSRGDHLASHTTPPSWHMAIAMRGRPSSLGACRLLQAFRASKQVVASVPVVQGPGRDRGLTRREVRTAPAGMVIQSRFYTVSLLTRLQPEQSLQLEAPKREISQAPSGWLEQVPQPNRRDKHTPAARGAILRRAALHLPQLQAAGTGGRLPNDVALAPRRMRRHLPKVH